MSTVATVTAHEPVVTNNAPWWDEDKKCFLTKGIPAAGTVLPDYGSSRRELYTHLHGTVSLKVWYSVLAYTLLSLVFFIIYHFDAKPNCPELNDQDIDDLRCRPTWFDEHLASLSYVSSNLEHLGTFVLTFYLSLSYARFGKMYWMSRSCQGALNNIAMSIGAALCPNKRDPHHLVWRQTFERYLTLVHILMYMNVSPYIKNKITLEKLKEHDCMGQRLLTQEEYNILKYTIDPKSEAPKDAIALPGSAGNGPMNSILVWICMLFDKAGTETNVFRANVSDVRMLALCKQFQQNIKKLRGSMASFGFEQQLPIALAYAHMMQLLVDVICLLTPFSIMYDINTLVVSKAGYVEHDRWATLPLTIIATALQVYFYQGLLALAKVFLYPFGRKMVNDANDPHTQHLYDKAFCIDVGCILKQTRCGTYMFFESTACSPGYVKQTHAGLSITGEAPPNAAE